MSDVRVSQNVAQIEWQEPSLIKVPQIFAQVEWEKLPHGTYVGNIPVEFIPESVTIHNFVYTGDISFSFDFESGYGTGNYYTGDLTCQFTPESDVITSIVYSGDISLQLTPESDIIGDYGYNGLSLIEFIPESACATPIPGFDWYSGYGLVDLSFLDGNPPYYVTYGDIPITATLSSVSELYAEYEVILDGGVGISGVGVVEFTTPCVLELVTTGGFSVGGRCITEGLTPSVFDVIADGGIEVEGIGIFEFSTPGAAEEPSIFEIITSGGVKINGEGVVEFPDLVVYEIIAAGGIKAGGICTTEFLDVPVPFVVITSGGVKVGGKTVFEFYIPDPAIFEIITSGGVEIDGTGIFSYTRPLSFDVIIEGGVEVGGEEYEAQIYHTWVITGLTFEPSAYSGFDFNSYSEYQNKCYGLKDDGIYLLEGDTDDGVDIHTGINIGANNFGKEGRNKLRSLQFGNMDGDDINVKVSNDTGAVYAGMSRGRKAMIDRSVFGDDLDVSIMDFDKLGSMGMEVVYRK